MHLASFESSSRSISFSRSHVTTPQRNPLVTHSTTLEETPITKTTRHSSVQLPLVACKFPGKRLRNSAGTSVAVAQERLGTGWPKANQCEIWLENPAESVQRPSSPVENVQAAGTGETKIHTGRGAISAASSVLRRVSIAGRCLACDPRRGSHVL